MGLNRGGGYFGPDEVPTRRCYDLVVDGRQGKIKLPLLLRWLLFVEQVTIRPKSMVSSMMATVSSASGNIEELQRINGGEAVLGCSSRRLLAKLRGSDCQWLGLWGVASARLE